MDRLGLVVAIALAGALLLATARLSPRRPPGDPALRAAEAACRLYMDHYVAPSRR